MAYNNKPDYNFLTYWKILLWTMEGYKVLEIDQTSKFNVLNLRLFW